MCTNNNKINTNNNNCNNNNCNNNNLSSRQRTRYKSWRKLLWVKQPYPDNYVDRSFLSQLRRNTNVRPYPFWPLVFSATVIVVHVCSVLVFITAFFLIYNKKLPAVWLVAFGFIITLYGLWKCDQYNRNFNLKMNLNFNLKCNSNLNLNMNSNLNSNGITLNSENQEGGFNKLLQISNKNSLNNFQDLKNSKIKTSSTNTNTNNFITSNSSMLKSVIIIIITLLALSPILKSLTQSTSSDSIWSISFWLFIANICLNDYAISFKQNNQNIQNPPSSPISNNFDSNNSSISHPLIYHHESFHNALSTNLAFSGSIVLASRLRDSFSVFCFLLFSIHVFCLFPVFSRMTRKYGNQNDWWGLFIELIILATISSYILGGIGAVVVWLVSVFCLNILAPTLLIKMQRYKNEIQGPWDPAKPVLSRRYRDF